MKEKVKKIKQPEEMKKRERRWERGREREWERGSEREGVREREREGERGREGERDGREVETGTRATIIAWLLHYKNIVLYRREETETGATKRSYCTSLAQFGSSKWGPSFRMRTKIRGLFNSWEYDHFYSLWCFFFLLEHSSPNE